MDRESSVNCLRVFLLTTNLCLMITGLVGVCIAVASPTTFSSSPSSSSQWDTLRGGTNVVIPGGQQQRSLLSTARVSALQVFLLSACLLVFGLFGLVSIIRGHLPSLLVYAAILGGSFAARVAWSTATSYWSRGGDTFLFDVTIATTISTVIASLVLIAADLMYCYALWSERDPEKRIYRKGKSSIMRGSSRSSGARSATDQDHEEQGSSRSTGSEEEAGSGYGEGYDEHNTTLREKI